MRPSSHFSDPAVKPNWQVIRSLIPYLAEFKWRVSIAIVLLVLAKIFSVATPWILKLVVDDLDGEVALVAAPLALVFCYGLFRFLSTLLGELRDTVFSRVTERGMRRVAKKVFAHLHNLDLAFHLSRKTGGLSRDIERGTSGINFLLRFLVFNIVPTFLELAMVVAVLWGFFSWHYCLIIAVAILTYVGFSVMVTEWRTKFLREVNELDSRSNSRAVDSLLNFETVKFFNNEAYEVEQYDKALQAWEFSRLRIRFSLTLLNSGQALIIASSMTVMLMLAAKEVAAGTMTIGDFVMINAYMVQLFIPLNFLGFVYREIRQALINVENMFGLLKEKNRVTESTDAKPLSQDQQSMAISFEDVHFGYDQSRKVLNGVSFDVPVGTTVAVVGASGAGKSTLGRLLFRYFDPSQGTIKIGGTDIREFTLSSLRTHIGVVPQDTVLFNDTIAYNIEYGRPGSTDKEVAEAVAGASLQEFIDKLPEGLNTLVGERGLKLSGGEKQRIAIARVLLKRSPILVFDEATSSLDTQAERAITDALNALSEDHTTVIIAHRLSTVLHADHIVVIDDGKVVEQGRHVDLLAANGVYAGLWLAQSQDGDGE